MKLYLLENHDLLHGSLKENRMWNQAGSIREDDERGWTLPLSYGVLCALLVLILKVAFVIISLSHKMMEKSSTKD